MDKYVHYFKSRFTWQKRYTERRLRRNHVTRKADHPVWKVSTMTEKDDQPQLQKPDQISGEPTLHQRPWTSGTNTLRRHYQQNGLKGVQTKTEWQAWTNSEKQLQRRNQRSHHSSRRRRQKDQGTVQQANQQTEVQHVRLNY